MIHKAISQILSIDEKNKKVYGYISLVQKGDDETHITIALNGLKPGKHALHIHEKGDPTQCCGKLGGHYNPFNKNHGPRTNIKNDLRTNIKNEERHVGDLGNITIDKDGYCFTSFTDPMIKLSGPYSVIGRSFVVHENEDDLGLTNHPESKTTGNSGPRIAYGIIGIA